MFRKIVFFILAAFTLMSLDSSEFDVDKNLEYCAKKTKQTLQELQPIDYTMMPRNILQNQTKWNLRKATKEEWTAGFWPGILWYDYQFTKDPQIKVEAEKYTSSLEFLSHTPAYDHDLGFIVFSSYGNAYKLTGNADYKRVILQTADTLATLFNPKVGTILSWPRMVKEKGWPHNTIMDNMINLELLFWASKHGGSHRLCNIAVKHAQTTMKYHFRKDYTSYHVALYNEQTGKFIKGITHQGYSDSSMWARGQAWAIYGYTMCYRETKRKEFLDFAQKVAEPYLKRLPKDLIPYWDFNAPDIPNAPRDASAAAIVASALLDLSKYVSDKTKAKRYKSLAIIMLTSLSGSNYQSRQSKSSFLFHSTGHWPNKSEIDASIIYADYYYIEALMKLKALYRV